MAYETKNSQAQKLAMEYSQAQKLSCVPSCVCFVMSHLVF